MSDSIYKINGEILNLKRMFMDEEIDEQMYLDTLDTMKISVEEKAGAVAYVNKEIKSTIEQIKIQQDYMASKKKLLESRLKKLNEHTLELMKNAGVDKCESGVLTISIQANGGSQALEIDEDKVPDNYMKIEYVIDKEKIREELEKGAELEFARLKPRGEGLRIR